MFGRSLGVADAREAEMADYAGKLDSADRTAVADHVHAAVQAMIAASAAMTPATRG